MPRAIAVTKLEQSRADFEETMARCRRVFGDVQPVGAPLIEDGHVVGAINLLRRSVTDYRSGEPTAREPDETAAIIEEHWDPLIESIIEESEDETLLDRHLSGEPIDLDIVLPDLRAAIATGGSSRSFPRTLRPGWELRGCSSCLSRDSRRLRILAHTGGLHARAASRSGHWYVTLTAHWSLRWCGPPATRLSAGSRWSGSSPALSALTLRCTSAGTCSSSQPTMSTDIRP